MKLKQKKYFPNLEGLRFILAFAVFASHSMLGTSINQHVSFDFLKRIITVFTSGHLGVSFFFVLSGFLITHLMFEEKDLTGSFSMRHFYIRRILRIWPLYFSVLFFSFFIYPIVKSYLGYTDQNPFRLIYQCLFLSNFDNIHVQHLNLISVAPLMISINWSVSIEEQFYVVWPILFASIKPNRFWIVCLLVIFASWFFRLSINDGAFFYYHTLSVISDMAIGGLGASLCFFNKRLLKRFEAICLPLIVLIYALGFFILMYSELIFPEYFIFSTLRILNACFFCFIILEQNFATNSWYKFGHSRKLTSLGKYTYGLYMLHPIGIQASIILFRLLGFNREDNFFLSMLYVLIGLIASITLSVLSYHLLEKYFLDKRKYFSIR